MQFQEPRNWVTEHMQVTRITYTTATAYAKPVWHKLSIFIMLYDFHLFVRNILLKFLTRNYIPYHGVLLPIITWKLSLSCLKSREINERRKTIVFTFVRCVKWCQMLDFVLTLIYWSYLPSENWQIPVSIEFANCMTYVPTCVTCLCVLRAYVPSC